MLENTVLARKDKGPALLKGLILLRWKPRLPLGKCRHQVFCSVLLQAREDGVGRRSVEKGDADTLIKANRAIARRCRISIEALPRKCDVIAKLLSTLWSANADGDKLDAGRV